MSRNKYAVARRSIWYVLRTLVIIAAVVAACFGVFVEGMHVSNLYILVTEGMAARAKVILQEGSVPDLTVYFTGQFVDNDIALYNGKYADFTVSGYDYRLDVKGFFVMPWGVRASMTVVEHLEGINASPKEKNESAAKDAALPEWETVRYRVSFVKEGTRWYISGLTLLDSGLETDALPTPDMSLLEEGAQGGG